MAQFYECEVFSAPSLCATWGINEGDFLGMPDSLCMGDIYTLARDAHPVHLRLEISAAVQDQADRKTDAPAKVRLAADQPAPFPGLNAGAELRVCAELRFMSSDSDLVTALLLACNDMVLLLPLHPMRPGMGYALITLDTQATILRMAELVQGCFAAGVRVAMDDGSLCPVEALRVGMQVRTRDHGPQTLRWIGQMTQRAHGVFAPVSFAPGILGNAGPLTLGPLQRIFLYQRGEDRLGTRPEILVQAHSLVDGATVLQREGGFVTYYSLVFDEHQIIYAEGVPVESMLVSRASVERLPEALAQDLAERFPHLNQHAHFAQDMPGNQMTRDQRRALLGQIER